MPSSIIPFSPNETAEVKRITTAYLRNERLKLVRKQSVECERENVAILRKDEKFKRDTWDNLAKVNMLGDNIEKLKQLLKVRESIVEETGRAERDALATSLKTKQRREELSNTMKDFRRAELNRVKVAVAREQVAKKECDDKRFERHLNIERVKSLAAEVRERLSKGPPVGPSADSLAVAFLHELDKTRSHQKRVVRIPSVDPHGRTKMINKEYTVEPGEAVCGKVVTRVSSNSRVDCSSVHREAAKLKQKVDKQVKKDLATVSQKRKNTVKEVQEPPYSPVDTISASSIQQQFKHLKLPAQIVVLPDSDSESVDFSADDLRRSLEAIKNNNGSCSLSTTCVSKPDAISRKRSVLAALKLRSREKLFN